MASGGHVPGRPRRPPRISGKRENNYQNTCLTIGRATRPGARAPGHAYTFFFFPGTPTLFFKSTGRAWRSSTQAYPNARDALQLFSRAKFSKICMILEQLIFAKLFIFLRNFRPGTQLSDLTTAPTCRSPLLKSWLIQLVDTPRPRSYGCHVRPCV